jgi:hypothetical protein
MWPGRNGLAVLSMTVLVGCVPLQQPPRHAAHSTVSTNSTVLFSVTLTSASAPDREPTGLVVDVESQSGAIRKQFAFTPNSRIPGHHTTFLVRLDLPAGAYGIPQFSGIAADGKPIPQFDVAPQMTFNIRPKATSYIGHVELSNTDGTAAGAARLVVADAYEDELPNFVHSWPALRGRAIGHGTVPGVRQIPVALATQSNPKSAVAAPEKLNASAAAGLPPTAQRAFRNFLHGSYPRAFALTASGQYTGVAIGGADVIGRALQDCKRAQPAEHRHLCRLFALDDTLLAASGGAAATRPAAEGR